GALLIHRQQWIGANFVQVDLGNVVEKITLSRRGPDRRPSSQDFYFRRDIRLLCNVIFVVFGRIEHFPTSSSTRRKKLRGIDRLTLLANLEVKLRAIRIGTAQF